MSSALQPPKSSNNHSTSAFPSSPADSNFTPRKEFVQAPPRQSSFALLAFTSNNAIRLSNFPQPFVTSLRSLLDSVLGLRSFRENAEHKLCEIVVVGKPWSNPKSLSTEIVLVQVFSVILAHGYSFLSQLDYGREHNDRLSLAFCRPVPSPNPNPLSPTLPKQPLLVPFALSFPSPTTLRVVCAPLHATPAILQSVRGAWPRGVTSEKKLGEGCFEFKLKGYSWFQEDTFPEDALAHILTLLTALDKHTWNLMTSISLTSTHARNKDLWIFSGPSSSSSPTKDTTARPASPVNLGSPLSPSTHEPIVDHHQEGSGDSESSGSASGLANKDARTHVRGATDSPVNLGRSGSKRLSKLPKEKEGHARTTSDPAAVLRKKTPPKRTSDEPVPGEEHSLQPRLMDHDIIPGPPPEVIYSTPTPSSQPRSTDTIHVTALPAISFPAHDHTHEEDTLPQTPMGQPPSHPLVSLPEPVAQHHADVDDVDEEVNSSASSGTRDDQTLRAHGFTSALGVHTPEVSTPPLLAPTAFHPHSASTDEFRDSAFSDATGHSFDVPIKWIPAQEHGVEDEGSTNGEPSAVQKRPPPSAFPDALMEHRLSMSTTTTGPLPPGGWAATPSTEVGDPITGAGVGGDVTPRQSADGTPRQNAVVSRSPQIVRPELPDESARSSPGPRRKSEAGVMGVVPSPSREDVPPVPVLANATEPQESVQGQVKGDEHGNGHVAKKGSEEDKDKPKEGWVLVSVAPDSTSSSPSPPSPSPAIVAAAAAQTADANASPPPQRGTTHIPVSAAQLIAAADATSPSKPEGASPSPASPSSSTPEKSTLSRLFSRRRASTPQKAKSVDQEGESDKEKEKGSRFRRKTGGSVLPTIRSGKRISID